MLRRRILSALCVAASCSLAMAQAAQRFPAGHADHGLPDPAATWAPYHQDPEHPANRIWRACYLVDCVPATVATALPAEHAEPREFFVGKWYFRKRDGGPDDRRLFGGDGRQLPVESFAPAASKRMRAWLDQLADELVDELKARPRAAVWLQHDLLRLARRLTRENENPELLAPLLACVHRLALPREQLRSPRVRTATADAVLATLAIDADRAVEVERRSSRLFDAEWVQLWSEVYVQIPAHDRQAVVAWLGAGDRRSALPIGTTAVLVQGIVAVDDAGRPVATDLVIEARQQLLANLDPLAFDNPTTTRDGVDFRMWSLERRTVRDLDDRPRALPLQRFREIDMASQELFRDYGSRKHTTYAAQCTLCHRRTGTPDTAIAGFSALRVSARPRPAAPGERRRRAEAELQRFLDDLRRR